MMAAVARQWWQRQWWQHYNSATAVAAVTAALRQQLGGDTAAAAWRWLRQHGSSGSGCVSSSVTVPQRWRGIGTSLILASPSLLQAWVELDVGWSVGGTLGVLLSVLG